MSESFRVGEIVIYHGCVRTPEVNGLECTIVDVPRSHDWTNPDGSITKAGYYRTLTQGETEVAQSPPRVLRRKRPPPKREETGEWDLCPWQPGKVTTPSEE